MLFIFKGKSRGCNAIVFLLRFVEKMFQFNDIQMNCFRYYLNNMTASNCLRIWSLANQYKFYHLKLWAVAFACNQFMEVINSDEYLNLQIEQLTDFLEYDTIEVSSEEDVFKVIALWIKHDVQARKSYFPNRILLVLLRYQK